jgi:predicted O-methyltransferase YrrM
MPKQLHNMWDAVVSFSAQLQQSEFMEEMIRRRTAHGPHGVMGRIDCATLYGLVRWHRPSVTVESGGYFGMSSAFILKALADEGLTDAKCTASNLIKFARMGFLFPMN